MWLPAYGNVDGVRKNGLGILSLLSQRVLGCIVDTVSCERVCGFGGVPGCGNDVIAVGCRRCSLVDLTKGTV